MSVASPGASSGASRSAPGRPSRGAPLPAPPGPVARGSAAQGPATQGSGAQGSASRGWAARGRSALGLVVLGSVVMALAGAVEAASPASPPGAGPAAGAAGPSPQAARGAALVEERNCGACHGERGISATPEFPSLAGQRPEFVALQLVLFREGIRDVPAMAAPSEGLTDAQVEELGAYFAALPAGPPPDRAPRDDALATRGAALSERLRCGVCHRPDLSGQNQVPRLTGQREDFLLATLRAYRDGQRVGTDTQMNGAVHGLSDADLAALSHYVAHR